MNVRKMRKFFFMSYVASIAGGGSNPMCTTMAIKTFSIPYWTNDLRTWTLLYRAIANGYETAFMCDARAEHTQKLFCRALLSRTVVNFLI